MKIILDTGEETSEKCFQKSDERLKNEGSLSLGSDEEDVTEETRLGSRIQKLNAQGAKHRQESEMTLVEVGH